MPHLRVLKIKNKMGFSNQLKWLLIGIICLSSINRCFSQAKVQNIETIENLIYTSQIAMISNHKQEAIDYGILAEEQAEKTKNNALIARAKGNLGFIYYKFKTRPLEAKNLLDKSVETFYKENLKNPEFQAYQKALVELRAAHEGSDYIFRFYNEGKDNHFLNTSILFTEIDRHTAASEILDSLLEKPSAPCENLRAKTVKAFSYLKQDKKEDALKLLEECTQCFMKNKAENSPEYPFVAREYIRLFQELNGGSKVNYPPDFMYAGIEICPKEIKFNILQLELTPQGEYIWRKTAKEESRPFSKGITKFCKP